MLGGSGAGGNRQEQFKRFLQQVSRGEAPAKALEDSFGMSLSVIENELKAYVRRGEFPAMRIASADPEAYASYTAMQRSSPPKAKQITILATYSSTSIAKPTPNVTSNRQLHSSRHSFPRTQRWA